MTLQAVLAATLAPRMLVLEAIVASVVAVHLRGRERPTASSAGHSSAPPPPRTSRARKIGVLNKIFGKAYQPRIWGKRVKKANRTAYYALKFALVGALIYLIFVA